MKNKENVRKWVDALRSGEFEQGTGRLRVNDELCCLGVACELAIRDGVDLDRELRKVHAVDGKLSTAHYYDGEHGYLPNAVMEWLGTEHRNPYVGTVRPDDRRIGATLANDSAGWGFTKIADSIEKMYLSEETELVAA